MGMYELAIITSEPCSGIWEHIAPYCEEDGDPSVESQFDYAKPVEGEWLAQHGIETGDAVFTKYIPKSVNKLLSQLMSYDIVSVPTTDQVIDVACECHGVVDADGQWLSAFDKDEAVWTAAVENAFSNDLAKYVTFAHFHM